MGGMCSSTRKREKGKGKDADPLKFIDAAHHELIFQHLTGAELLKVSEVSPRWYRSTAKSNVMMKKIKLSLEDGERAFRENIFCLALLSPRDYQHLYVCSQNKRAIIETFAKSLVSVEVKTYDVALLDVDLPNVKKLHINGDAIAFGLLSCVKYLEELHVESIRMSAIKTLKECLERNIGLKRLSLGSSPSALFNHDLSNDFDFDLDTFVVRTIFLRDTENLLKFMASQTSSLEAVAIHVTHCDSFLLNNVVNSLPKLTALYIHGVDIHGIALPQDLPEGLDLKVNKSITFVYANKLCLKNLVELKKFLRAVPSLECLRVMDASTEATGVIVRNCPRLQEFRTEDRRLLVLQDVW